MLCAVVTNPLLFFLFISAWFVPFIFLLSFYQHLYFVRVSYLPNQSVHEPGSGGSVFGLSLSPVCLSCFSSLFLMDRVGFLLNSLLATYLKGPPLIAAFVFALGISVQLDRLSIR